LKINPESRRDDTDTANKFFAIVVSVKWRTHQGSMRNRKGGAGSPPDAGPSGLQVGL